MMRPLLWGMAVTHASGQTNPVTKVIELLDEMHETLDTEAKTDAVSCKKMECWSNKQLEEKQALVDHNTQKKALAEADINTSKATMAEKTALQEKHEKIVADSENELKTVTALREKEAKEAVETQEDLKSTITALGQAIDILGNVQKNPPKSREEAAESFLQVRKTLAPFSSLMREDIASVMRKLGAAGKKIEGQGFLQARQDPAADGSTLASEDTANADFEHIENTLGENANTENEFDLENLEPPTDSHGNVAGIVSYNAQSGSIYGILEAMEDDFKKQLSDSIANEAAATENYNILKAEKEGIIESSNEIIAGAKQALGEAAITLRDAQQSLSQADEALAADTAFMAEVSANLAASQQACTDRMTQRNQEISAVNEALEYLHSDEARTTIAQATGLNFVQVKSHTKLNAIFKSLDPVNDGHREILALIASANKLEGKAQLDAFSQVKDAVALLKDQLKKQRVEESTHRDQCIADLHTNDRETAVTANLQEDTAAEIAKLNGQKDAGTAAVEQATAEIEQTKKEQEELDEDRKEESAANAQTVVEQQAMQSVLAQVILILETKGGYENHASFMQVAKEPAALGEEPERSADTLADAPEQSTYKQNTAGSSIIVLLHSISSSNQSMIVRVQGDESKAQTEYEKLTQANNDEIARAEEVIASQNMTLAAVGEQLQQQTATADSAFEQSQTLLQNKSSLKSECDFFIDNFEVRQQALLDEIDMLDQVVAVLSGADPDA